MLQNICEVNIQLIIISIFIQEECGMALKNTIKGIQDLLASITSDLQKAENGNKAASQRVRTGTIKLEKIAKVYRKESISDEKKNKGKKAPKATASKKHATAKHHAKPASKAKAAAKPKKKAGAHHKASVKSHPLAAKRPTAKLPSKKAKAKSWLF
jgi:hypothetical protein